MVRFIHTAVWQIGKPHSRVENEAKRTLLRQRRIDSIKTIGELARTHAAQFVLVAGDLFDTNTPDKSTVAATCSAIGSIGMPVYVIPGNHDYAGTGSIRQRDFFLREQNGWMP